MSDDPPYLGYAEPQQRKPSGLAVASMVCGIVSVPLLCIWFMALPLAIVALILGIIARNAVRRGEAGGGGMATAGIACAGFALGVYLLLFAVAFMAMVFHMR
jgi:hypothetical protein